jgi:predicted nucleotidyltransferase
MKSNRKTNVVNDFIRYFNSSQVDESVMAVYLFGSSITGETKNASDIDLAFLLHEKSYKINPIIAISPAYLIAAEIAMRFDRETDVTILNSSSLELAYEIMVTGKCIYEADSEVRLDYGNKIRGMYFDFKPFLDELRLNSLVKL